MVAIVIGDFQLMPILAFWQCDFMKSHQLHLSVVVWKNSFDEFSLSNFICAICEWKVQSTKNWTFDYWVVENWWNFCQLMPIWYYRDVWNKFQNNRLDIWVYWVFANSCGLSINAIWHFRVFDEKLTSNVGHGLSLWKNSIRPFINANMVWRDFDES